MKILLIMIGSLAGFYTIVGLVRMVSVMTTSNPNNAYGLANMASSVVPVAIGAIICLVCFQKAFAKTKKEDATEPSE